MVTFIYTMIYLIVPVHLEAEAGLFESDSRFNLGNIMRFISQKSPKLNYELSLISATEYW